MSSWTFSPAPPSTRLYLTIGQMFLAAVYLGLLIFSIANKGWWMNLCFPTGFGIGAAFATNILGSRYLVRYRVDSSSRLGRLKVVVLKWLKILVEFVMMGLWTTTFVCMLLPKGKDFKYAFVKPPYGTWDAATALACIQM